MPIASIKVLFVNCVFRVEYNSYFCCLPLNWGDKVFETIAQFQPDVIVTSGDIPDELNNAAFEIRKRWIDISADTPIREVERQIEFCYNTNLWGNHPNDNNYPLITVFTPTYNSNVFIDDAYQSLLDQSYKNWEWVIVDDGSDDCTYKRVLGFKDSRIRPYMIPHNGKIGALKNMCCRLAYGSLLVELDHDDILIDTALEEIKLAFDNSSIGMVYSNFAEFKEDGTCSMYHDEFWKPRYRDTEYRGRIYKEARAPSIYGAWGKNHWERHVWFLTVGPNHVRAYRKSELERLEGYNRNLPVADDWDIFFRFFLYSRCWHIDKMLYLYRLREDRNNTFLTRNRSIQDHLELCREHYTLIAETMNPYLPVLPSEEINLTNPKYVV